MSIRRKSFCFFLVVIAVVGLGFLASARLASLDDPPQSTGLLAGRNVNMVSGTRLPWGDPWLQRQNEPSLAASTRNPMHLLSGANDYRTIDIPDDFKVPGIPPQAAARDAWLGLFKSFDGGESWITTLLPGYPLDSSTEGLASPIHGFEAACDPCVRAGSNGLFFYSGIAFNRYGGAGAVFLARFIDNNNLESVQKTYLPNAADPESPWQWTVEDDPIKYVDTRIIDTGNPGQFIDMPTVVADIPRSALAGSSMIKGQTIPNANVYMAYSVFLGNTDVNIRSRLVFVRSTNCGQTWAQPIKLSEGQHIIQRPVIAIDPSDLTGNTIYVAFRRFAHGTTPGGIVLCKSIDGGRSFTKPIEVETLLSPFDQAMDASMFRTNSYPTMAVDGSGIVYIAWAQRMNGSGSKSRIVLKTSTNGVDWSGAAGPIELTDEGGSPLLGNQFMPALAFAAGRGLLAWYDQRETVSPDNNTGQVADNEPHRQTIDVRAAEIVPGPITYIGPSYQVSRYLFFLELDEDGNPVEEGVYYKAIQAEYNPPNLPLFQLGTRPFLGDYIDIAPAPLMLPPALTGGSWAYNTASTGNPVMFHAAWADDRDVRPPANGWWGNWANYNPPFSPQDGIFAHDGPCDTGTTGMRNQNVYTANIARDVFVGSPWNSKQLNLKQDMDGGSRTFVVLVKNFTDFDKSFNLAIQEIGGVAASFDQMTDVDTLAIDIAAYSSYSCTVFVDTANGQFSPVKVNAYENSKLVGFALLNPDPTTLPVDDPGGGTNDAWYEKHNPRVQNPRVHNYDLGNENEPNPRVMNPRVQNPRVMNPRVMNPRVMNPRVQNPRVMNPRVQNDSIVSCEVANPRVQNPRVMNTALTDVTWIVSNEGNTTSAYTFNIVSTVDNYFSSNDPNIITPLIGQVLVYKLHLVPGAYGCDLAETHEDELLVNYTNPRVQNPRVMNATPEEGQTLSTLASNGEEEEELPKDITFWLAPGEEAYVTFRVWDDDTTDPYDFDPQTVTAYVEAEAINTGETAPSYALPDDGPPWVTSMPQIGYSAGSFSFYTPPGSNPPGQILTINNVGGGTLDYTVTVDMPWLPVTPSSGTSASWAEANDHTLSIVSATMAEGIYAATITVTDFEAANNPVRIPVVLTVSSVPPPPPVGEWILRYDTPLYAGPNSMEAMTVDSSGNTYVTGSVRPLGPPNPPNDFDYLTAKIDPSGSLVWAKTYDKDPLDNFDRDLAHAIAVDLSGNVIVTGQSGGDMCTIKYSASGVKLWEARYHGGPAGWSDEALAVTVDGSGNIYVAGQGYRDGGEDDIVTIKYSPGGTETWVRRYEGPLRDQPRGIAVDGSGNVYVTGRTESTSGFHMITMSYDASGILRWNDIVSRDGDYDVESNAIVLGPDGNPVVAGFEEDLIDDVLQKKIIAVKYGAPDGSRLWLSVHDAKPGEANAVAIMPDGAVYVAGYRTDPDTISDFITLRMDGSDGEITWSATYDGDGANDVAEGIAIDATGNVFVTGTSLKTGRSGDFTTVKYSYAGGGLEWERSYNGTGNGNDTPIGIGTDSSGNVYVAGSSPSGVTGADFTVIKYKPSLLEWLDTWNGPDNGDDVPQAMAVDGSGNAYIAASSENGDGNADYLIVKYDPSGAKLWEAEFNGSGNGDDLPSAIAVDPAGNVFVTGSSLSATAGMDIVTMMYDSAGNHQWTAIYGGDGEDLAHAIAVDPYGVYVTGRTFNGSDFDWVTIKYSLTGTWIWNSVYDNGGGDWPFAIAVDAAGDVYVTGESVRVIDGTPQTDTEMTTIKYSGATTGAQLAIDRYHDIWDMGSTSINQAVDITIREVGGETMVVVTGIGDNFEAGSDFATIRYDTNLARRWEQTYNGTGGMNDIPANVEIDPEGNVVVTGESPGGGVTGLDFATVKYGPDGTQLWVRRLNGSAGLDDSPAGLALDGMGNVYVTGWSTGADGRAEYATVKYDPAGVERWVTSFRDGSWGVDMAKAVAVDGDGNVIVTGQSQFYATGPLIHWNIVTIKYRKEGF